MHETTGGFPDVLDRRGDLSRNSDSQRVLRGCSGRASDAGRLQSVLFLRNAAGFFQKKTGCPPGSLYFLRTLYFSASQAGSTNVHSFVSILGFHTNGLHIGFPHLVGTSMRMAYIVSEINAFFADCTLCHDCTSLI